MRAENGKVMSGAPLGELRGVSKEFVEADGRRLQVLDSVDLQIYEGEWLAVLGQSGCGKSTLLRCLLGLVAPSQGEVWSAGRRLEGIREDAALVFQTFALFPWLTVEQNIAVGLAGKGMDARARKEAVWRVVRLIGLEHYHAAYPGDLSGGMRHRVGIARALVSEPDLLCLDEAFSELDVLTAENLREDVMRLWQGKGGPIKSVLMVTHTLEEAVEAATRICVLFPHPGRVGLVLDNPLPYPRDTRSREFLELVALIHDAITSCALPDRRAGSVPLGEAGKVLENGMTVGRLESIPCVPVGQILGLLSVLSDEGEGANIYDLSDELGRELGGTLALVQAAEMLGFVKTPKDAVVLTEMGRELLKGGVEARRQRFGDQLRGLALFRWALAEMKKGGPIEVSRLVHEIARAHPYENAERVFETMVAWGRFGGVLNLDRDGLYMIQPQDLGGMGSRDG